VTVRAVLRTMSRVHKQSVSKSEEGRRLDTVTTVLFPELTRSQAQRLIREGLITVGGKGAKCSHKVSAGDEVTFVEPDPAPSFLKPEEMGLDIVYEDTHLVVVNKPPGLVVHPGAGVKSGTLVNALLAHCGDLSGIGGVLRPGIVHRLDKGTSGLLVVAKTDQAHVGLARQIAERKAKRRYLAVVWGIVGDDRGEIEAPVARSSHHRKKMAVDWKRGKRAVTRFEVVERFVFASLLNLLLETGRTHQIRVHLSHRGHPVFGDPQYGGRTKALSRLGGTQRSAAARMLAAMERPALHAAELSFVHPVGGEQLSFEAPPPSDILELLGELRSESP
jgi:23S rRNA pseudouridine1911/1915/1917 synthase